MTITPPVDELRTPIDDYLARQHDATAVERFSQHHDRSLRTASESGRFDGEQWYADRVPLSAPGVGEQYAFRVDLDRCSGCKACVAACHSLNGLDEGESWRDVGQLVGRDPANPRTQSVPTGCHHCVDPACLSGCPTNAYEKDPFSGIVKHLDDQCIGCGYCELTCPYEVPKLNARLGVVRKCDMCADRLAEGEAPACVQACPTQAISITIVDQAATVAASQTGTLVPGAPASSTTSPTTQYVSRSVLGPDLEAADHHAVRVSHSHPPLAFMLVLTQLSVGAFVATVLGDWLMAGALPAAAAIGAAAAGVLALAASVLHLGRPLVAWRAVLGIGHSWLSREIVAFGVYAPLAVGYAGAASSSAVAPPLRSALAVSGALAGLAGIGCSVMIYVATGRTWWRPGFAATKFLLSGAVTGPLLLLSLILASQAAGGPDVALPLARTLAVAVGLGTIAKLVFEALVLSRSVEPGSDLGRTATLLRGPLRLQTVWRFALGVIGGVLGPLVIAAGVGYAGPVPMAVVAVVATVGTLGGELIERRQFFAASVAPRMPGGYRV